MADFGIAKSLEQLAGTPIGPVIYLAPEIEQDDIYDCRVDIFSFGLLLFDIWHQHGQPRYFQWLSEVRKQAVHQNPITADESCPLDYVKLIQDCCHPNPKFRPTWTNILKRLEALTTRDGFTNESFGLVLL